MSSIQQELESFTRFASARIADGKAASSIDDLYDQWRDEHASAEDALAVAASLRDMARGETGREFSEFASEFRQRNQIAEQ